MKEWHTAHMEKIIVKYVKGLSETASAFEKRNHKKYGTLTHVCKQIEYDIKHGVTHEQVISLFHKVRHDSSFSLLREGAGAIARLDEVEIHFTTAKADASSTPWISNGSSRMT